MYILRTWLLCSGVAGGFGVFGREPPWGVQCRSRARAVRKPSVTRLFYSPLTVFTFRKLYSTTPKATTINVQYLFRLTRCILHYFYVHPPIEYHFLSDLVANLDHMDFHKQFSTIPLKVFALLVLFTNT